MFAFKKNVQSFLGAIPSEMCWAHLCKWIQGLASLWVCTMETYFWGWYSSMEGAAVHFTWYTYWCILE